MRAVDIHQLSLLSYKERQVEIALFDCLYVILNISYTINDMYSMWLDMMLSALKQYYF